MRYVLLAGATAIGGYVLGLLFGWRAATVDYVENDAHILREMADSMYESEGEVPEEVQEIIEQAEAEIGDDDADEERGATAFQ